MNITFLVDVGARPETGNENYRQGDRATLAQGQELIDLGLARAGWGTSPIAPAEPVLAVDLDELPYRELQEMAKAADIKANQPRDVLLQALRDD